MSAAQATAATLMPIADIKIGNRFRKDMGDVQSLADSIARNGLLHPVVVRPDGELIAGARRIAATRALGWQKIPATILDVEDLLSAERDENVARKNFPLTEAVEIGALIEDEHRAKIAAAKPEINRKAARNREARRRGTTIVNDASRAVGKTNAVVGKAVGMSETTYTKAKAVVVAAKSDPTTFGDLPVQMDATGNVDATHREMKRRKAAGPGAKKKTIATKNRRGKNLGPKSIAKRREVFFTGIEAAGVRFASLRDAALPAGLTVSDVVRCVKTLTAVRRDIGKLIDKLEEVK